MSVLETGYQRRGRRHTAMGVIALLLLAALVVIIWRGQQDKRAANQNATSLGEQVDAACQAGGQAAAELRARGACGAARSILNDPAQAAPVANVITDEQVRRVVTEYLEENPPAPGHTPSTAEVTAVVQRVCERVGCEGPPGKDGEAGEAGTDGVNGVDGANGADGVNGADGQPGPPPTDEQVRAVVEGYCASHNGCRPTAEEVAAAVQAYCAGADQPCRGQPATLPDQYTRIDEDPLLGSVTWSCARTTPPETLPPSYTCTRESP